MKQEKSFLRHTLILLLLAGCAAFAEAYPDKIKGIALYSDDLTPVRGGVIEVVSTATPALGSIVLERVSINPDGTFMLSSKYLAQTDDIKIMAYPNDVDGTAPDFENAVFSPSEVYKESREGRSIVIKVNRYPKSDVN